MRSLTDELIAAGGERTSLEHELGSLQADYDAASARLAEARRRITELESRARDGDDAAVRLAESQAALERLQSLHERLGLDPAGHGRIGT